jgi:hypothetical protein
MNSFRKFAASTALALVVGSVVRSPWLHPLMQRGQFLPSFSRVWMIASLL